MKHEAVCEARGERGSTTYNAYPSEIEASLLVGQGVHIRGNIHRDQQKRERVPFVAALGKIYATGPCKTKHSLSRGSQLGSL